MLIVVAEAEADAFAEPLTREGATVSRSTAGSTGAGEAI